MYLAPCLGFKTSLHRILEDNQLEGPLPQKLGQLSNLEKL